MTLELFRAVEAARALLNEGHPLRRLPDDGGASCTTWEAWR